LNTLRFGMCAGGVRNEVKINIRTEEKNNFLEEVDKQLQAVESKKDELEEEVKQARQILEETEKNLESQLNTILELQKAAQDIRRVEDEIQLMKKAKADELDIATSKLLL
jgi:uncharacterized protein HemX